MLLVPASDILTRSLRLLKLPVAVFFGVVTTVLLLYLMQSLIDSGEQAITNSNFGRMVDFVRIKEEPIVQTRKRRPQPPPIPDQPPPPIKQQAMVTELGGARSSKFYAPMVDIAMSATTGFYSDGEYMPILKVLPVYPQWALQRSMFGWVIVEFTVDDIGRVIDPIVIDNCVEFFSHTRTQCTDRPGRIFDKPAMDAAKKFKYKPKIVNGIAIATTGVRHLISFELDDMQDL